MSNWWEAYPVVSADALSKPEADQAVAVADKPDQVESPQKGNWWEAYPVVRADVGPKALLSGIEDNKKQQEEQARLHEAQQSIETYGEIPTVASQVVLDTTAVANRVLGFNDRANQNVRDAATLDQAMRERDAAQYRSEEDPAALEAKLQDSVRQEQEIRNNKQYDDTQKSELISKLVGERQLLEDQRMSMLEQAGQYMPFLKQGTRGAARSLGTAVLGSKGAGAFLGAGNAAYGAIGLASAQEANRAITEGTDAGLEGSALAGYVASQGIIEAFPATLMQKLGLGGVESLVAGPAIRGGVKAGFIAAVKATGQEIPEELETELLSAVSAEYAGVDKEALDPDRLSSLVADTVLQTVLMGAGAGAVRTVQGAAQEREAALAAKQFESPEIRARNAMSALEKPPGAHKWAEIYLGDRKRFKEAPDEATRTKQWEESRGTATETIQPLPTGASGATSVPPPIPTQATPPALPPTPPVTVPPPLPQRKGPTDASQVPANDVQGDARTGSQVTGGSEVRGQGQVEGGTQPASQEPSAPQVQVGDSFEAYVNEWNRDLAKRLNKPEGPVTDAARKSLETAVENTADEGIKKGRVTKFASDNATLDELQLREVQNAVRRKGYDATDIKRSSENGVDYLEFSVSQPAKPSGATAATAPTQTLPKPSTPEAPKEQDAGTPSVPPEQAGWDVVEGQDGKLYRQNPNAKTNVDRIKTRQAVDPSEGAVLITQDKFGKPIPEETLKARQEFADKAKPGVEFEWKNYQGQSFKVLDDGTLLNSSGRKMGTVQSNVNTIKPSDITWKETPSAGLSEESGTKPTTVSSTASPDASATPKTSMGETGGAQSSEARADDISPEVMSEGEFAQAAQRGVIGPAEKPGFTRIDRPQVKVRSQVSRDMRNQVNDPLFDIDRGRNLGYSNDDIASFLVHSYMLHNNPSYRKSADTGAPQDELRKMWSQDAIKAAYSDLNEAIEQNKASIVPDGILDESSESSAAEIARRMESADIDRAVGDFKNLWGMEATATPADKLSDEQKEALDFATSRGQKMAFVDIAKSDKKAPIGSFHRDDKVILISNTLQGDKLWGMIGHEMAHSKGLDEILPADSAELQQMMDEYYASANDDVRKRLRTNKRDHQREGRARMVQKFFEDKAFRDRLKQNNPTMWEKLREAVLKFIGQWTPKDEAKRMLLEELRAAPKPEKIKGKKPQANESGLDKPESGLTKPVPTGEQDTGTDRGQGGEQVGNKPASKPKFVPGQSVVKVVNGKRSQVWTLERRAPAGSGYDWYASDIHGDRINLDESEIEAVDTTQSIADQVNVDSGAESEVKSQEDELDAMMDDIMADMEGAPEPAKPESPEKPKSLKKPKAPKAPGEGVPRKSAQTKAKADEKLAQAKQKMLEAFKGTQGKPTSGLDAEVAKNAALATKLYIEGGVLNFQAFIERLVEDFSEAWVRDKAPYLESAWRVANKRGWVDSPSGKVEDALKPEATNYGTLEAPNRVELGKHFQQQLEAGKDYKSIVEARKEAATLIAGEDASIEPGTPAAKAIDEAVEQGVVRAARSIAQSSSDPLEVYDALFDLYERQPRLAVRTGTSMRQQAYSTPAPAAWIANILSDTSRDNTAYDSSAGNGMLLLGVEPENAIANELNPDRAQALRELGYQVHEGDATQYTPEQQPDRIIINPPFGELEGKTWSIGGTTTDKIDHAIVLKTLESLPEDGKAVLIIGSKGFEQRQPKDELRRGEAYKNDKNFYNALYDGYNVTDHFTLHGDLYSKQGAAFPIDVIVIDGRGQSAIPKPYQIDRQNAIPRVISSWKELRDVGERYLDTGTGRPSDLSTEPVADDMGDLSSLLEGQGKGTGKGGRGSGKNTGGSGPVPPRGDAGNKQPRGDRGQPDVPGGSDGQGQPDAESIPDEGKPSGTGRRSRDAKGLDRPSSDVEGDAETEFQVAYKKRSGIDGVGTLVPRTQARAVEDALEKAEARYGNLDEFVANELGYVPKELGKYFSAEQVDALALAIARHKEGKAFVLGDQTGVGKGRVAAGMMVYAKRQGLVPVFMTQSPDLYADMYRDLQDIGQHSENEPFYALATNTLVGEKGTIQLPGGIELSQTADFAKNTLNAMADSVALGNGPVVMITVEKTTDAKGNPLGETPTGKQRVRKAQEQRDYDAVFTTYSQMQTVGGSLKDRHTALSRMAPSTFFVLDESHNAGGGSATDPDAQGQGTTRAELIRAMLNESKGVLFLSATYAKRVDVMDLYAKTGMGDSIEGTEDNLVETLQQGGIPLQQVLSEMLVEAGAYMRRERSFEGIDFEAKVEETGIEEAGQIADIFGAIDRLDRIKNEIIKSQSFRRWLTSQGLGLGTDSATGRRGMESSTFSSIVHNLVNQMLLSIKADATASAAIASLERGEAPVIALSNTMGSALNQYLETNPANIGDEIDFRFSRAAERYLERSREIMLTDVDSAGRRTARQVRLPDEVLGEDGLAAYDLAKELIDSFAADIPASPIDHIRNRIEEAGYTVREVTGRDLTVDYSEGKMRLSQRPKDETGSAGKLATVKAFNSGELDVMILNQSGSTGLSAHASKLNPPAGQKRRHMIVAQADANIDTFMQMLGRINRTGQVTELEGQPRNSNLPHYTLLMTNVPAETRPAAVLIKKLSSLNANVTADSKGSVSFDAPDILNKVGDRVVAEYIADNPALNHALGDIVQVNAEGSPRVVPDIARKVSGRMAMRPIPEQQAFWDSVTETYAEEIDQLNKLGKNPLAATKMDLGARTLERVEIFSGDPTADSPFLQPAYADRARVKKQGEPMTPDEIKSAINKFYGIRPKRKRGSDPFGDMTAELHREALTGEDAEQNVTVSTPDLGRAIREWSISQAEIATEAINAKTEQQISRLVNQEAIDRVRVRASTVESTIRRRLNSVAPGMSVGVAEVQDENGGYSEAINGIVIDVKAKKGKEHLPSGWVATIAISSPDRVIRVPFSRIETAGNSQPGDVYVAPNFEVADDRIYGEWEEIGDVYEERIIGTGNVLAAFDRLVKEGDRGNIVFFTNEEGVSQRGVLMPRSFNLDRWAEKRPVTFTTAQQVLDFISIEQGRLNHQANDPNFAIQFVMDGSTMLVRSPRSRQRSGRYTTNKELIEASGTDFVSVGQILQMKVRGKKQQLAVIAAAQKLGPLIAANFKEDAKRITEASAANSNSPGQSQSSSGVRESRSLDAFTSPELQDRQSMGAAKMRIASAADLVGEDDGGSGSQYASPDEEFERRWQRATKGIGKKTLATKLREFWQELVKSTVRGSLPELPRTEQFGEARSAMHAYQNAPVYAQLATADLLKKTSKPLSASDYDLFTRIVIMRDQVEAAERGERLSYGLTPSKAKSELDRLEALAESNERVQASLEYRRQWTEAMVDDFLSAHEYLGLDMSDRFKRENYFRHQVLYYMEAQQRGLGKKKVELTPNRSWLKGRTSGDDLGEAFDINANYLQAEWEVSTQMIADTKRAQAIGRLKRHYDKMRQLKAQAKQNNYVAVVGGQKNMNEIEDLRAKMEELRATGSLDSDEKAQLKAWSERLWELDPTMPFRQEMAIARNHIERGASALGEEVPDDFMRYVASLAKQDDSPLQPYAMQFLKAVSDRKAFIKNALGDKYETWEDVVPDDHEEVAIRPGRAMFQAYSVPEQIASELMADLSKTLGISAEDLRPLTALGSKYTPLVVPKEVAAQMSAIDNSMDFGWLDHIVTRPMNAWKRWVLMSPTRVIKYNLRNLSEIDKVMALNPAAMKDIPQAIRDLWKLYSGADDIPATVRDWVERGGSGTLVRVNELGDLNELKEFARLLSDKKSGVIGKVIKAPANLWRTYWSKVGMGSDFRESILRYAAYLNYVKQLEAGKLTNYGGSVRAEVDGIKDNKDKAMRLSADLLGDYGDISIVGQFLRSRVAPFWSFQETNVRTYFRGLINLASNEQSAIKAGMAVARAAGIGGLAKTPFLAYKLGRIAILFYGLKAMTTVFNQMLFGDDDDELPEDEKRKAHLTFGKNSKGEVQYFSRIGTAADVLDWVGLDSVDYDLRDVLDGRRTLREVLGDMAKSPVDKAYGMLSPFMKAPTELAVGQTAYPSVGKPRPIRDRGRYIAQNLGIQKEYDKLMGNPSTPYSVTDMILYKVEPGTSAYYMTQDAKFRWLKTARNRGVGYSDSVRGNALRSYKMAVRLNDQVAADKYLAEYEAAGGKKEGLLDSLEWNHPAGGLSTIDAYLFYKSLSPVEQDEYRKAEQFYYSELLTEDQAKEIRKRREKRLKDLAVGKNKDGSPKGKPEKQQDETNAEYRERKRTWEEERKTAREALQEFN